MDNIQKSSESSLDISKYFDIPLYFNYYYKYTFHFSGKRDDIKIIAGIGGSSDNIYKIKIERDNIRYLSNFNEFYYIIIYKGEEILFNYFV